MGEVMRGWLFQLICGLFGHDLWMPWWDEERCVRCGKLRRN